MNEIRTSFLLALIAHRDIFEILLIQGWFEVKHEQMINVRVLISLK